MTLILGISEIVAALAISYWEGEGKKLTPGGFVFITFLGLTEMVVFVTVGKDLFIGDPKPIDDAIGAYTTLSRVNEGNASYSVAKDANGNIKLLRGEAKMPSLKSFAVNNKGEVVEFK